MSLTKVTYSMIEGAQVSVLDFATPSDAIASLGTTGGVVFFPYNPSGYSVGTIDVNQSNITLDFNNNNVTGTVNIVPQSLVTSGRATGVDYPSSWRKSNGDPAPVDGDFDTMMYEEDPAKQVKNIVIKNMRSTGNAVCIRAYSVDGLTITNCNLTPVGQSAIRAFHCANVSIYENTLGGSGTYTVFNFKCREARVTGNWFTSTTALRALSFKGCMHEDGQTIFQNFSTLPTYYRYFNTLVSNNCFFGNIDGCFWDTTPDYTPDAATEAGAANPIGFSNGDWFGRGVQFNFVNNQVNLFSAVAASNQGRAFWVSAPHQNITVSDNNIQSGGIFAAGSVGLIVNNNQFNFIDDAFLGIFIADDTPSSTTSTHFKITDNVISNFDAVTPAIPYAIQVKGDDGVISNNVGYNIGGFSGNATNFIGLVATSENLMIENNKLYKNGGAQTVLDLNGENTNGKNFGNDTFNEATNTFTTDGYKTGTFVPTISGTTSAGTATYSVVFGKYTLYGDVCFFDAHLDWTGHTGTGNMILTGLPFSSSSTANSNTTLSVYSSNLTYGSGTLSGWVATGSSQFRFKLMTSGGASADVPIDAAGEVIISGFYFINP